MQARNNETGFSTLVALTSLACIAAVSIALAQLMGMTSKVHRDTVSNSEINSFHGRIQKLLATEWSCTISLRGANYNDPIILLDPVSPGTVLAQAGTSAGPFWSLASVTMSTVRPVVGRDGVYSGQIELAFSKQMTHQAGAPIITRVINDIWFEAAADGLISRCYPNPTAQAIASAACKSLGGSWVAERAFGSQCTIHHGHEQPGTAPSPEPTATPTSSPTFAPTEPATPPPVVSTPAPSPLPSPTSTTAADPTGLCFDTNAGIIAVANSQVAMSGNGAATTRVYLLDGAKLTLSGNAEIRGMLYEGAGASYSTKGNAVVTDVNVADLSSVSTTLSAFAAVQTALVANVQLSKIDESMTLSSNGRKNVIQVGGDVNLTGDRVLTLSGGETDTFVINVIGKITVSGNAQIILTGGVLAKNVVFNNIGIGNEMVLAGNGSISGTFLALQRGAQVSGNGQLTGALIAGGGTNTKVTISGNGLAMTPQPFCTN